MASWPLLQTLHFCFQLSPGMEPVPLPCMATVGKSFIPQAFIQRGNTGKPITEGKIYGGGCHRSQLKAATRFSLLPPLCTGCLELLEAIRALPINETFPRLPPHPSHTTHQQSGGRAMQQHLLPLLRFPSTPTPIISKPLCIRKIQSQLATSAWVTCTTSWVGLRLLEGRLQVQLPGSV